jgi:hypothetical protein
MCTQSGPSPSKRASRVSRGSSLKLELGFIQRAVGTFGFVRRTRATLRPVLRAVRATFRPVLRAARAVLRPVLRAVRVVLRAVRAVLRPVLRTVRAVLRAVRLVVAMVFLPFCFDVAALSSTHFLQTLPSHRTSQCPICTARTSSSGGRRGCLK